MTMERKIMLSGLLMLTWSLCGFSQQEDQQQQESEPQEEEARYLLGEDGITGGFGGPSFGAMPLGPSSSFFAGGGGGFVYDHRWIFGGYGMGGGIEVPSDHYASGKVEIGSGQGGVFLGRKLFPKRMLHPYLGARVGFGGLEGKVRDPKTGESREIYDPGAVVFAQPHVGGVLKVSPFFEIHLTGAYRYLMGTESLPRGVSDADLTGAQVMVSAYFGAF